MILLECKSFVASSSWLITAVWFSSNEPEECGKLTILPSLRLLQGAFAFPPPQMVEVEKQDRHLLPAQKLQRRSVGDHKWQSTWANDAIMFMWATNLLKFEYVLCTLTSPLVSIWLPSLLATRLCLSDHIHLFCLLVLPRTQPYFLSGL